MKKIDITRLFLFILPTFGLILFTNRLWFPLIAQSIGKYDEGKTFEVNMLYDGFYGGEIIKRNSTGTVYNNYLYLRQVFPSSTADRHPMEGTEVKGYFINFPFLFTEGIFVYEDAPFVKEWLSYISNVSLTLLLLFLQISFFIKRKKLWSAN